MNIKSLTGNAMTGVMKNLLLIVLFLFTGCTSTHYTSFNSSENNTGSLEIEFVNPGRATVTIDDIKIDTPKKWVSSVVVSDLDPALHHVKVDVVRRGVDSMYATEDSIQVSSNQKSIMIVNNPKNEGAYWAMMALISVSTVGVLAATGFYDNPNE